MYFSTFAVLIITYIRSSSSRKYGYAKMLNLAGVYNTLRGNVLCQHGNNNFFNDDNPETDMMGIIFRIIVRLSGITKSVQPVSLIVRHM